MHTLTLKCTVDQDALDEHVAERPNEYPLVADVSEFTWDDLTAAVGWEYVTDVEIVGAETDS